MKFRASQLGKLMVEPRSKSEVLSETAKTYLKELAIEMVYGVSKDFSNKYTIKGVDCENESIQLVSDVLNIPFLFKNEQTYQNDWILGTPDVVISDLVIDVKTSWNLYTFPFFEKEIPNKDYFYQLQAYMWLTGIEKSKLCYCLINTPEDLIGYEPRELHIFDNMPIEKRVKTYDIDLDLSVIDKIKIKCENANEYFNELIKEL